MLTDVAPAVRAQPRQTCWRFDCHLHGAQTKVPIGSTNRQRRDLCFPHTLSFAAIRAPSRLAIPQTHIQRNVLHTFSYSSMKAFLRQGFADQLSQTAISWQAEAYLQCSDTSSFTPTHAPRPLPPAPSWPCMAGPAAGRVYTQNQVRRAVFHWVVHASTAARGSHPDLPAAFVGPLASKLSVAQAPPIDFHRSGRMLATGRS